MKSRRSTPTKSYYLGRRIRRVATICLSGILLAACGGISNNSGVPEIKAMPSGGAMARFVACLRDAGLEVRLGEPNSEFPQDSTEGMVFVYVGDVWRIGDSQSGEMSASPNLSEPSGQNAIELLGLNTDQVLATQEISNAFLAWEAGLEPVQVDGTSEQAKVFAVVNSADALRGASNADLYPAYAECEAEHPDFSQPNPRAGVNPADEDAAWLAIHLASLEFARCARSAGSSGVGDPAPDGGVTLSPDITESVLRSLLTECLTEDSQIAIQVPELVDYERIASDYADRVVFIVK